MEIKKLVAGVFQTNTYILIAGDNAAVIDPAGNAERIYGEVTGAGAKLTAILLTHGHYDHTSAADELKELSGAPIHIHESDAVMLGDQTKSYASLIPEKWRGCEADVLLKDGDTVTIGDITLSVMATAGHSAGSVMFVHNAAKEEQNVIFSGDTLFADSVGRTDGWSGSAAIQRESLEKIKAMQGEYRILTGHGHETTLKREKRSNPFLVDDLFNS
jgi:glyoxylase-like metal-dependent hydrolase (beta-lactamase superfamily II)